MSRDTHGRYINLKAIIENGPEGAHGCPLCKFGIVSAPDLVGAAVPLYLQRLVQAIDHELTFCGCQAGKHYRISLANRRLEIIEQMKQAARGKDKVDNPIDVARTLIRLEQAKRVPTIHLEKEPVTA